jgi:hypothetical protein
LRAIIRGIRKWQPNWWKNAFRMPGIPYGLESPGFLVQEKAL